MPILRWRTTATTTHCLVEDPAHPGFCYQLPHRWLVAEPPPALASEAAQHAIALSLVALDRLVQLLLGKYPQPAGQRDEDDTAHPSGADLAPPASGTESAAQ